jgi:hypothetical protein
MPMECYTCTDAEYEVPSRSHVSPGPAQGAQLITVAQVFDNGVGGYPASAQCSATMQGCLYCWKQTHVCSTRRLRRALPSHSCAISKKRQRVVASLAG